MKYTIEIRAVPQSDDPIAAKHKRFVEGLSKLSSPWAITKAVSDPDPGTGLVAVVSASKMLGKGVTGYVAYQFRRPFDADDPDDYVDLTFNPMKVDYPYLIDEAFLSYVSSFEAYYAEISDEFIYLDFDDKREAGVTRRDGVFRVAPISYWHRDLCKRAFGLSPSDVVKLLRDHVEEVREALYGVFCILTREVLPTGDMDSLCKSAKRRLVAQRGR